MHIKTLSEYLEKELQDPPKTDYKTKITKKEIIIIVESIINENGMLMSEKAI